MSAIEPATEAPPGGPTFGEVESELDSILIQHCLVDSLHAFLEAGQRYPFVDMRELKPGAAGSGLPEREVLLHRHGLLLFVDGALPSAAKKDIRFKDRNRVVKENLVAAKVGEGLLEEFSVGWTRPGDEGYERLVGLLVESDFGLVVQRDRRSTRRRRYALTHFRVRIDWPVVEAAESLAKELKFLSRHLFENSEQQAEQLEAKMFERFGFHHTVGGRRTAAVVGAQYLRDLKRRRHRDLDFRVYVGSSEARTLTKIHPEAVERYALVHLGEKEVEALEGEAPVRGTHAVHQDSDGAAVFVLEATYLPTDHARPTPGPRGSRPTEGLAQSPFLRIESQALLPRRGTAGVPPIPVSLIYRASE